MESFLKLNKTTREQYITEATARHPIIENPVIMEKDFWVCWVLDQLYSIPEYSNNILFKGGTSLSKCYNLIQRFSEDCDLTIDKKYIGILDEHDPCLTTKPKERKQRLVNLNTQVKEFINSEVKMSLHDRLCTMLDPHYDRKDWQISLDEDDLQSLLFHYPSSLEYGNSENYIKPVIKLELGANGDMSPSERIAISPYIQSALPNLFGTEININVNSLLAKRTFWEKIVLLHKEHHRTKDRNFQKRLFRHYYDVTMLHNNGITQQALSDTNLLNDVVNNTKVFYRCGWANYDDAKIGSFKLTPNNDLLSGLKEDYQGMNEMFFGETPDFDQIINTVEKIEQEINSASK